MKTDRPVNINPLTDYFWPFTAIVSITNRVLGIVLFVGVAFGLYLLDLALSSEAGFAQAQDFKVDSMRQALAKVWGLDEWKNTKENRRVDGGDKRRSENKIGDKLKKLGRDVKQQWKDDLKDFNPSRKHKDPIKPMESAKKSGKTDTGGKMAEVEIDPELKDKK